MIEKLSAVSQEKKRILKRKQRLKRIFLISSLAVLTVTVAALVLPAITSSKTTFCGFEEHSHTQDCYSKKLICGFDETQSTDAAEEGTAHVHVQECYEFYLSCNKEEHTHSILCMSDPTADVETIDEIESAVGMVTLTGDPARDILNIALSQMGYSESIANYDIAEDGETIKGYTRYGEWFGDPYADWNGLFVSFCANYANVGDIPRDGDVQDWITLQILNEESLYRDTAYTPGVGDIVFFDTDSNGVADRVAIVSDCYLSENTLGVIEGDSDGSVRSLQYTLTNETIVGYIQLADHSSSDPGSIELLLGDNTVYLAPGYDGYLHSPYSVGEATAACYALITSGDYHAGGWTPSTTDWQLGADANYTIAYCLNRNNSIAQIEQIYTALAVNESEYSDVSDILYGIMTNAYPFITADQMRKQLSKAYENGEITIDLSCCTENEFVAAVQWAIWDSVDPVDGDSTLTADFSNKNACSVYPPESEEHTDEQTINSHVKAIRDWLISSAASVKLDVADVKIDIVRGVKNTYNATVTVTLNRALKEAEELMVSSMTGDRIELDNVYGQDVSSFSVKFEGLSAEELLDSGIHLQVVADDVQLIVYDSDEGSDLIGVHPAEIRYDLPVALNIETTSVDVKVEWNDAHEDTNSVEVVLFADGNAYGTPVILDKNNNWSYRWDGLIKYSSTDTEIDYTLKSSTVPGYLTSSVRQKSDETDISYTLTNTLSEESMSIKIRSEWSGRNDGKYPENVTVQLLQNGADYGSPVVLDANNNWAHVWQELTVILGSESFEYSVRVNDINGYTTEMTITDENGLRIITIVNKWTPNHLPVKLETVDINSPTMLLSGAVFDLFCVSDSEAAVLVPGTTDIYAVKERTIITGDDGSFMLDDLLIGNTYCLVETGSPIGYSKLAEPIVISVERTEDGQGELKVLQCEDWVYVIEDGDENCTLSVKNRESYILPETGGPGSAIFYLTGLLLLGGAALYISKNYLNIFWRKRK